MLYYPPVAALCGITLWGISCVWLRRKDHYASLLAFSLHFLVPFGSNFTVWSALCEALQWSSLTAFFRALCFVSGNQEVIDLRALFIFASLSKKANKFGKWWWCFQMILFCLWFKISGTHWWLLALIPCCDEMVRMIFLWCGSGSRIKLTVCKLQCEVYSVKFTQRNLQSDRQKNVDFHTILASS